MNWIKKGILFVPQDHELPLGCRDFAQSPQAVVLKDRVRIFFSARSQDSKTTSLSYILYVDYDRNLCKVLDISSHPVIELGQKGCFDEHGIFPLHVTRVGSELYGYISGISRRSSVPIETSIGLAISKNEGKSFTRIGPGPIMSASLNEPLIIGDPFVVLDQGLFHMFYLFSNRWIPGRTDPGLPDRVYKLAHATSSDGINWKRDGRQIIPDVLNHNECQALPSVIYFEGSFHMVFCYREASDFKLNRSCSYRLGYAQSSNLSDWHREELPAGLQRSENENDWDHYMMCYPHLFILDKKLHLLYNGNDFGRKGFGLAVFEN